jgi:hypothetical protein
MKGTSLGTLLVLAAGLLPVTAPAQDSEFQKRVEELRKKREEKRKEREKENAARGGAPGQAGSPTAQAAGKTQAQGGAAPKAQGGAGGKAQAGGAGKGGAGGTAGIGGTGGGNGIEGLRTTRPERRRATLERLRERWGPLLGDVRAREELRVHAERLAQLERIRALAEQKRKPKIIEQLDAVLTQEELRHSKTMNSFRESATPAAAKP